MIAISCQLGHDDTILDPGKSVRISLFNDYHCKLMARLKEAHDDDAQLLPIPATYIINSKGIIVWRQFDPDYKQRSSVKDILDNLPV